MLRVSDGPPPLPALSFMMEDPSVRLQSLEPPVSGKAAEKKILSVHFRGLDIDFKNVLFIFRERGRRGREGEKH